MQILGWKWVAESTFSSSSFLFLAFLSIYLSLSLFFFIFHITYFFFIYFTSFSRNFEENRWKYVFLLLLLLPHFSTNLSLSLSFIFHIFSLFILFLQQKKKLWRRDKNFGSRWKFWDERGLFHKIRKKVDSMMLGNYLFYGWRKLQLTFKGSIISRMKCHLVTKAQFHK